jgi:hypothetical protein
MGKPKQFLLPVAVDEELERLLEAARHEGNRVSRSDIVAALIWQSRRIDGDALGLLVRDCRRAVRNADQPPAPAPPGPRPYLASPGAGS